MTKTKRDELRARLTSPNLIALLDYVDGLEESRKQLEHQYSTVLGENQQLNQVIKALIDRAEKAELHDRNARLEIKKLLNQTAGVVRNA